MAFRAYCNPSNHQISRLCWFNVGPASAVYSQRAVSPYSTSKHILTFDFAEYATPRCSIYIESQVLISTITWTWPEVWILEAIIIMTEKILSKSSNSRSSNYHSGGGRKLVQCVTSARLPKVSQNRGAYRLSQFHPERPQRYSSGNTRVFNR